MARKAKVLAIAPQPLVLVIGMASECSDGVSFIGGIKGRLPDYGLPGVAACFPNIDRFQVCFERMLGEYSSIKLVVLRLRGIDTPDKPIKIIRKRSRRIRIIGIAPLRKNNNTASVDFASLDIIGYHEHHPRCIESVAMAARKILRITTPIKDNGGLRNDSYLSRGSFVRSSRWLSEEPDAGDRTIDEDAIDFGITKKRNPSLADLTE